MLKTLAKYLPVLDYFYIYQILEYNIWDFIKWFASHPFKRNLQKKHTLQLTKKMKVLALFCFFWMVFSLAIINYLLGGNLITLVILIATLQLFSPVFIILSHLTYSPIDIFLKERIIEAAKLKLKKSSKVKIVAITGSLGKTSTKDILYTLLWKKFRCVKTPKSFNTSLGVANTILNDLKDNSEVFIVEIGAYRRGEIAKLAGWVKPQISVITAVAPQHLERFGSLENIAHAKFELVESLGKDGKAFLNGKSDWLQKLASHTKTDIKFYGGKSDPYFVTNVKSGVEGTSFILHTPQGRVDIKIPLIGEHHAGNFMAAAVVAMQLGLSLSEVKERAKFLLPTPHRLEIKKQDNLTVIDNTYNTNPQAARASLKLLSKYPATQRIIVTPGLVELGKESPTENQAFAKEGAKVADKFIIVGKNAKVDLLKGLAEARFLKSKIHLAQSTQAALALLPSIAKPDAVILLENDLPDQYF